MPYCYAPGCNHISKRETCGFFRFPADKKLFEEWKTLCPIKEKEPTNEDHLCSCHFIDGDKVNLPTVFTQSKASFELSAPPETITDQLMPIDEKDHQTTDMLDKDKWECRACLEKIGCSMGLINLFQPWTLPWEGMESTIAEDLAKVGHIKLSPSDKHSKFICDICYTKLQNACSFAAVVQKNDHVLKQRFPHEALDPGDTTDWPRPIQLDKNINGVVFESTMDIEIKQEVLSDNDYGENMNGDTVEIKIEPEEMMRPQQSQINGTFSYNERNENITPNGSEMLVEFLDTPLKDEPISDVDSDSVSDDLPLECMLCAKVFLSMSGLKAHVIGQHSYKTVKRKMQEEKSPPRNIEKYVCATCRRSFVTSTDLMVHETCHNKATCYGCNQKFDTFEQLTRHRVRCKVITSKDLPKPKTLDDVKRIIAAEHKSTDEEDLPKEQLQCHLCTEKFSDWYYMRIHQEIHHSTGEPPAPPDASAPPDAPAIETAALESIFSGDP